MVIQGKEFDPRNVPDLKTVSDVELLLIWFEAHTGNPLSLAATAEASRRVAEKAKQEGVVPLPAAK